jgi:hypothetical protein
MKTKPRIEWNGLPGLLAAERMPGQGDRDDFNRLDLGIDAATLEEFLKEPIKAIAEKMQSKDLIERKKAQEHLATLVIRCGKVLVMAERERAAEEKRRQDDGRR